MGATAAYGFPYPSLSSAPDGPDQIQDLAEAIETKVIGLDATDVDLRELFQGYAQPSLTASGTLGATVTVIAGTLVIPDPGFTYRIVASGSYGWGMTNGSVTGLIGLYINIDSTTYSTNVLSTGFGKAVPAGAGATQATLIAPERGSWGFTPFTGSHTVRLHVRNTDAAQPMILVNTSGEAGFNIRIVPV